MLGLLDLGHQLLIINIMLILIKYSIMLTP